MIELENGGRIVEDLSELPVEALRACREKFLDFETTSGDDKLDSLNPWYHCGIAGFAITGDELPGAWYVGVGHRDRKYCHSLDRVADLLDYVMTPESVWVNHHVKYDAHVMANAAGVLFEGTLWCTIVQAKLLDTDRMLKGGYGLDVLSRDLLGQDISAFEDEIRRWLYLRTRGKNIEYARDYGRVPVPPMAPYACQDVITNRRLHRWQQAAFPDEMRRVQTTEVELTRVLFEMERYGARVDPMELKARHIITVEEMLELDGELSKMVGRTFNPTSSDQLYDVLCNQYGLPVLGWTEGDEDDAEDVRGGPSFDKEAMSKYLVHPLAPFRNDKGESELIKKIRAYKKRATFISLFLQKYQELGMDGRMHGTYNQMMRTGRLSCSDPNFQQLDADAKELILPDPDCAFLCMDQSQIEFRIIAHYIKNKYVIDAYCRDPDTDFHNWVASMSGMKRRPAKTMNFMMGYGGGKKKAVKTLSINTDVTGKLMDVIDGMIQEGLLTEQERLPMFEAKCRLKAEGVYDDYHRTLPELKPTSRQATAVCKARGYVKDPTGRRRHLPPMFAHKAFNSLCQGYAAGIQKMTTVSAWKLLRGTPIAMSANVHDETVFHGPRELLRDRRVRVALAWTLENPRYSDGSFLRDQENALRVPLRVAAGYSEQHWREASKGLKGITPEPQPIMYDLSEVNQDDPLYFLR